MPAHEAKFPLDIGLFVWWTGIVLVPYYLWRYERWGGLRKAAFWRALSLLSREPHDALLARRAPLRPGNDLHQAPSRRRPAGEITCSVRIWMRPHVKVGHRYKMDEGEIEVDSILPITLADITPELAPGVGLQGRDRPLEGREARPGENVYLVRFHYIPPCGSQAHSVEALRSSGHASPS